MSNLKRYKHIVLCIIDMIMVIFSYILTALLLPGIIGSNMLDMNFLSFELLLYVVAVHAICFISFNFYSVIWKYARPIQYIKCFLGCAVSALILISFHHLKIISTGTGVTDVFFVMEFMVLLVTLFMSRLAYSSFISTILRISKTKNQEKKKQRVMVIGAGSMADMFLEDVSRNSYGNFIPVCIVDDDRSKKGKRLHNVKIKGNTNDIHSLAKSEKIDTIVFCIKDIDNNEKMRILRKCTETKCRLLKMSFGIKNNSKLSIQKVSLEDLLGRPAISLDNKQLKSFIGGKVVMVTGGGGSIGSELCRHIAALSPKMLIILDNYENNAYNIQQELIRKYGDILNLKTEIASVCDREKMIKIFEMYHPEVVYHAAAHKHVPLMEHNPEEAVKNNIFGTLNISKLAGEYKVKKFVLVSTDKAVNPTNIMGATKRCCEMIIQSMDNLYKNTTYVAVRFGNVLGSNGSVIPLFEKQISVGGPVTVTHPDIIRYFMTIPEAVQLLLSAGSIAKDGDIFILDMGEPVKIVDLATQLITLSGYTPGKDIEIKYTGLRPGEKLFEELLMSEEGLRKTSNKKIFIANPTEIDKDHFFAQLEKLRKVAFANDTEGVCKLISEIVVTYHKPDPAPIKSKDKKPVTV